MSWLLLRRADGTLEVELDALADAGQILGGYPTRPEAVAARDRRQEADEREAMRDAGQKDLFPC